MKRLIRNSQNRLEINSYNYDLDFDSVIKKKEALQVLDELGYEINEDLSFTYENRYNDSPYLARYCHIVEKDTKRTPTDVNARRDSNFMKYQALRTKVISGTYGSLSRKKVFLEI